MITVYHGSVITVKQPIAKAGHENLDFGQGFYVTDIKQQQEIPLLNIYQLDLDEVITDFSYLKFSRYDEEWLDFIVKSRKGLKPWAKYDIVEGGVANDRVIDTVEAYMNGMITVEMALDQLSQHQPNNQFCLLNQQLIDQCLQFISVEQINL